MVSWGLRESGKGKLQKRKRGLALIGVGLLTGPH